MRTRRIMTLTLEVSVPAVVGENEVETAVNAALDEDETMDKWGADWEVGAARITDVRRAGGSDD